MIVESINQGLILVFQATSEAIAIASHNAVGYKPLLWHSPGHSPSVAPTQEGR